MCLIIWDYTSFLAKEGEIFQQKGYRGVTIDELCAHCQLSKPTLYYCIGYETRKGDQKFSQIQFVCMAGLVDPIFLGHGRCNGSLAISDLIDWPVVDIHNIQALEV